MGQLKQSYSSYDNTKFFTIMYTKVIFEKNCENEIEKLHIITRALIDNKEKRNSKILQFC